MNDDEMSYDQIYEVRAEYKLSRSCYKWSFDQKLEISVRPLMLSCYLFSKKGRPRQVKAQVFFSYTDGDQHGFLMIGSRADDETEQVTIHWEFADKSMIELLENWHGLPIESKFGVRDDWKQLAGNLRRTTLNSLTSTVDEPSLPPKNSFWSNVRNLGGVP